MEKQAVTKETVLEPQGNFVIKYIEEIKYSPCFLCGKRTQPTFPFAIFECETGTAVCDKCAGQHAPELLKILNDYYHDGAIRFQEVVFKLSIQEIISLAYGVKEFHELINNRRYAIDQILYFAKHLLNSVPKELLDHPNHRELRDFYEEMLKPISILNLPPGDPVKTEFDESLEKLD